MTAEPVQVEHHLPVTHTPQGIVCTIPQHLNDTDCTHRTQPSSVDVFHSLQTPSTAKNRITHCCSFLTACMFSNGR
ncbi:hypothetical protein TNCV_4061991 [Trichonephila clavipes]|nr:hypothetical protein TNCV_4061991 [Trichonephila clavipes]